MLGTSREVLRVSHDNTHAKHINIHHHFICEHIKNLEIKIIYCSTKDMVADIFTKQLLHEAFKRLQAALVLEQFKKPSPSGSVLSNGLPDIE